MSSPVSRAGTAASSGAPKYFEVDHSPMVARVLPASGTIDGLNLKLTHIEAIAQLLLCQDGAADHVVQNAAGAIESIARECHAISRALWTQMNGATGAAS